MSLPYFQTTNKDLTLLQNSWTSQLNPVLANPITNPSILKSVSLVIGDNVINHKLGVTQQGWFITDITAASAIYRNAPFNNKTLTLNSSAVTTVNIAVF